MNKHAVQLVMIQLAGDVQAVRCMTTTQVNEVVE